jgi:hypothetical protein
LSAFLDAAAPVLSEVEFRASRRCPSGTALAADHNSDRQGAELIHLSSAPNVVAVSQTDVRRSGSANSSDRSETSGQAGTKGDQPAAVADRRYDKRCRIGATLTLDDLAETSEIGDWKMPDFKATCAYAASQGLADRPGRCADADHGGSGGGLTIVRDPAKPLARSSAGGGGISEKMSPSSGAASTGGALSVRRSPEGGDHQTIGRPFVSSFMFMTTSSIEQHDQCSSPWGAGQVAM